MTKSGDSETRGRRRLATMIALSMALIVTAAPAEARRKFSFGGTSSSATSTAKAAKAADASRAANQALLASTVHRATRQNLSKIYDLPETDENALADGRHFHIGKLRRALFGWRYVGYLGALDYVDLPSERLQRVLQTVGFNDVTEFEAHLAKRPPVVTADDTAATTGDGAEASGPAVGGMGAWAKALLTACCLAIGGFLAYCGLAWRRNRRQPPATAATAATARMARMASPERLAPRPDRVSSLGTTTSQPASRQPPSPVAAAHAIAPHPAATTPRRVPRKFGTQPRLA